MANVRTAGKGFITGLIIFVLLGVANDFIGFATMNLFTVKLIAVDAALGGILGALTGTVVGWWLGRGTKAAA
jgi:membrane protein YqaA with SNARE-associated domain